MSPSSETMSETLSDVPAAAPAALSPTRPFYWSVRREVWENRSLYIAPMVVAGLMLFGFLIGGVSRRHVHMTGTFDLDAATRAQMHLVPFAAAAAALMVIGYIVAVFYCLGALHNERRDRSILFWKSLPVSDLTTVLAKASVPLVVLPVILLAVTLVLWLIMLVLSLPALLTHGGTWAAGPPWYEMPVALVYILAVVSLWQAPIYGWLVLVSAWAKRAPFLWAVLPPIGVMIVEKIAFDTGYFGELVKYRLVGWASAAFIDKPDNANSLDILSHFDPVGFVSSPGLWAGLAVAAGFFAAAIWLRRYRGPA